MKASLLRVRDSFAYRMITSVAVGFFLFFAVQWCTAQQVPQPTAGMMPPPTCPGELATAKQYNTILLNNTTQYETSARELWQKVQDVTKERDEALAKLKALESPKEPAPPATN
jgi:hypothetical protein